MPKGHRALLFFLAVLFLTPAAVPAPAALPLYPPMKPPFALWIDNGRPRAEIVLCGDRAVPSSLRETAGEINAWLRRMADCELPVVETPTPGRPHLYLGLRDAFHDPETTAGVPPLDRDGYLIRSRGRDLVIAGDTPLGAAFGTAAFLEHYLGCRWFWPGEHGMYWPRKTRIAIGGIDEVSRPAFRIRWIIRRPDCALFNRLNVGVNRPGEFNLHWFVHTWLRLVPPAECWPGHREYYAEFGGHRQDPSGKHAQVNLCTANPDVVRAAVRTIDGVLAKSPGIDMISVDPMDTQQFCQCPECSRLYRPDAPYERRASALVFDFTRRIAEQTAKTHPGLWLKTIAYHTYLAPPADPDFRLPDNVVVQFCRFMCHNHPLDDPACPENRYFYGHLKAWTRAARHVMLYEYYYKASWSGLPWPVVHSLRRDIPTLRRLGLLGIASQWSPNAAANGLVFYVAAKLLWDPGIDVDALLADFYATAYGQAAAPMRRYHERLEAAARESGIHLAFQRPYRDMLAFLGRGLPERLGKALDEAERRARDPRCRARIALMRKNQQYCVLVRNYLQAIAGAMGKKVALPWRAALPPEDMDRIAERAAPAAAKLRAFLEEPKNREATGGLTSYSRLLIDPRQVAGMWGYRTDRDAGLVLDKPHWLTAHPDTRPAPAPATVALWLYGNDLDWTPDDGAEHRISLLAPDGKRREIGSVGRKDRNGNRKNLCFVLRHVPAPPPNSPLRLLIENVAGGPYASRIFAVYAMPDDSTAEDAAQEKIEHDRATLRRRAFAFVEFGFDGAKSNDGRPLKIPLEFPGR